MILESVPSLSLEVSDNKLPHYHKVLEMRFSSKEELLLAEEFKNFLQKGIIKESLHEEGEFMSSILLVPKFEDSFKMILDLKILNENMHILWMNIWHAI